MNSDFFSSHFIKRSLIKDIDNKTVLGLNKFFTLYLSLKMKKNKKGILLNKWIIKAYN